LSAGPCKNTPGPHSASAVRTQTLLAVRFQPARRANPSQSADTVPSDPPGWTEISENETVAPGSPTPKGSEVHTTTRCSPEGAIAGCGHATRGAIEGPPPLDPRPIP